MYLVKVNVILVIFYILFDLINLTICLREIRIGGIFGEEDIELELAFQLAIDKFNKINVNETFHIIPITSRVDRSNTLQISKEICRFLSSKIVGIFGPNYQDSSYYVQSICDNKEMPHIENHWDKYLIRSNCLVNLYPYPESLKNVYVELVKVFEWKKFTIIYENEESLARISKLLTMLKSKQPISLRQIDPESQGNYRKLLQKIKQAEETNFILDCSIDILDEFLKQAQQVSLVTERQNYIITNLDLHTIELAQYQFSGCNITGVRLVNPENSEIVQVAKELLEERTRNGFLLDENYFLSSHLYAWKIRLETFLLMDSVQIFLDSLKDLSLTRNIEGKQLYCHKKDSWEHGYSLINSMRTKNAKGLSGLIKFDTQGFRSDYVLEIIELIESGINKIGTWNSTEGLNITRHPMDYEVVQPIEGSLRDKSFKVLLALTPPYAMLKETPIKLSGNDRFEGFGVDLIKELSSMLGFNYTFITQEDGQNGNYDRITKKWNGMIGEIMAQRADLAVSDLTITSERLRDVDFTNPFMNLGISILYRKPEPMPPSLFTFASPFSVIVWLLLGIAYFFISLCFFIIGRLCPSEWNNPYPCVDDPEHLINQFTLRNSLWFTIGSLMQQGSEIAPVGISTRMASGVWWFFTLIMVSSYTANLAAFLTIETLVTPFKNIDELARQMEVFYGAKKDGATYNFFRDSNMSTHKHIYETMYRHPEYMTTTNEEGVKKVENENYAFLMESTTIEYVIERHCTLAQVGGLLDDKGYGIAMKKNATYRDILSAAVVRLQESGTLSVFKIKWWKEDRGGGNCEERASSATPLDLKNLGGVFFVLGIGTCLGVLSSFLEMGLHIYKRSKQHNTRYEDGLRKEFKHFVKLKRMERSVSIIENNNKDNSTS